METYALEEPTIIRKQEAISFINEFYECHSEIHGVGGLDHFCDDYEGWLIRLKADEIGTADKVPAKAFFLIRKRDNRIIGMINILLTLNERLRKLGGHIGYSIRPSERGHGNNKINLYLGLKVCQKHGIKRVYLDADRNNPASWRTMEALGAVLIEEFVDDADTHEIIKKYAIDVNDSIRKYADIYEKMIAKNKK